MRKRNLDRGLSTASQLPEQEACLSIGGVSGQGGRNILSRKSPLVTVCLDDGALVEERSVVPEQMLTS